MTGAKTVGEAPQTLAAWLETLARVAPSGVAVTVADTAESLTYATLHEQANAVAAGLRNLGLRRGDALAVWLPNGIPWLVLEFAAARLGILVVGLNPRYKVNEVAHLLAVSQARVLVFTPRFHGIDFAQMVKEALGPAAPVVAVEHLVEVDGVPAQPSVVECGVATTRFEDLMVAGPTVAAVGQPSDLVNVFGTSGTTSFPKLAAHDQGSVVQHAHEVARALDYDTSESVLCFLPFCGAYGFIALTSVLAAGGRAVILPVWSVTEALSVMSRERVTALFALEGVFRQLFAAPELDPKALTSWRKGGIAGVSALAPVQHAEQEFGVRLTNLYGSSELFAMMCCWDLGEPAEVRAVAGGRLVGDDMHARAVDPETRDVLADGVSGELEFSGYNVLREYMANPAANEAAFTADRWYRTGDHGATLDGGRAVRYESRLADTLRLRGYLVSPTEIEELLVSHGSVQDVEVVGVLDESTGEERAVAFALLADPTPDLEEELREHCRTTAASWKVPDAVVFLTEFPTTPGANGEKVQKAKLRQMATELLASRSLL